MPIFQASASLQANTLIVFSDARAMVGDGGRVIQLCLSLADTDRIKGVYAGKSSRAPNRPLELVVNLKTAKPLGLTVPRSILARADK